MKKTVQINIPVDEKTKEELQRIARKKSIEEDKTISYMDLLKGMITSLIEMSGSKK